MAIVLFSEICFTCSLTYSELFDIVSDGQKNKAVIIARSEATKQSIVARLDRITAFAMTDPPADAALAKKRAPFGAQASEESIHLTNVRNRVDYRPFAARPHRRAPSRLVATAGLHPASSNRSTDTAIGPAIVLQLSPCPARRAAAPSNPGGHG